MNSHKSRIFKNIISSILVVLIFVCLFLTLVNVCFNFLYLETNVRGFSMQPTININVTDPNIEGDKIYINKYTDVTNNDIVVAKVSWFDNYIIKRVVGIPGDKIEIKDETTHFAIYVNDNLLYTKEKYGENRPFDPTGSYGYYQNYLNFLTDSKFQDYVETDGSNSYIKLDENEYFLMGDNWGHTTDCIIKGPAMKSELIGKVELIVDVENKNPFTTTLHFLKKIFCFN